MDFLKKSSVFLLTLFLLSQNFAFAETTENWVIKSFSSNIYLNTDSSADITETIVADFTNESHRGIERDIPYSYVTNRTTPIKLIHAIDENGASWNIKKYQKNGHFIVEITTPDDHRINGEATFIVKYHIDDVFNFFEEHDEFYWNVNGTDGVVPTNYISATIHSPIELKEPLKISCLTGEYGGADKNCEYKKIDAKTIQINTTSPLAAYENLTVVFGLPKGIITKPSLDKKILWFLTDNKIILLPIIVFLIMLSIWLKYGRDDQTVSDTIVPSFTPPKDLSPSEIGTIIDERMDPRDITAAIIDFAVKGYIKIQEIEKPGLFGKKTDYELELVKPHPLEKDFEKKIILGIFDNNKKGQKKKISDLENNFYTHVDGIKSSVMKALIDGNYFPRDPETVKALYSTIGFGTTFVAVFIASLETPIQMFSLALSGLIIAGFGAIMPRKTKKGTVTYYQLKGLYEYINTAEKDRMKFQEQNNIIFEKLLPHAMAFGLIDKWTRAFDGILKTPPSWYYPVNRHGHFNMLYFGNSLSNFSNSTTSNLTTRPGNRGGGGSSSWSGGSGFSGGFSGGGFGGGSVRGL